MACTAIVGINWGDEGKGRMVDLLTEAFDIVVRFQGGANAGHTLINQYGKFDLHLLPSGVCRPGVVNILGNGVALDPETLIREIEAQRGISITPDNLMISERASLLLPWHHQLDVLEEARTSKHADGSTKQGIAPFYSDKNQKKTILAGELFYPERLKKHLKELCAWKNLTLEKVYGAEPVSEKELNTWLNEYCERIKPFIRDTRSYLIKAESDHKRILFEAQLGALRDLDFGIYPYTTSVSTLASYAPIGAGVPGVEIDRVIGVTKSYSTCVGNGPFVCEYTGKDADAWLEMCHESNEGGRPVRIGPIDLVATKYGVEVQAATELAMTKLDVLSSLDEIPLCVGYKLNGEIITEMPFPAALEKCEPVYETMKGWKCNICGIRNWWELPEEAKAFVNRVEQTVGQVIRWISVGPERHSIIRRG
ncbi:MAG: adenylosuccinate synthase [Clostridia bacterium]|nr:adenylosuccinate synthase [Clostridia bacterium]MBR6965758.1 adenylosuccinate synthase [Clostridia bacterium]